MTLAGHLAAYGASEVAAKASRLIVVVAVARTMDAAAIGLAATALAASDILKSLTENGVGQKIIAAPADQLEATCATARRLFILWCGGLFALQATVALIIWLSGGGVVLSALVLILAAEYLFMPAGLVQVALAMREGKLKQTAAIGASQVVGANMIAAVLAVIWPGALALVLPRLLAAPIWLVAVRRLRPWRVDPSAGRAPVRPFLQFGWAVLGVEVVKALRLQADKLVIGALLGPAALGLYFLAFNAGLGLATSFSAALSTVLFPHLCNAEDRGQALRQGMILSLVLIVPVVVLQALAAPLYVPILFGDGWDGISDVVSTLCLVAIPTTLWAASAGWLRANGRPGIEFAVTAVLTASLIAITALLAPYGLLAIAKGYLVVASVIMGLASLPAIIAAFPRRLLEA